MLKRRSWLHPSHEARVSFRPARSSYISGDGEMAQEPVSDQTAKLLREAWFRFLDAIEPVRPSLYRYCRRMTRDVWDAEDLLQDTLLKVGLKHLTTRAIQA